MNTQTVMTGSLADINNLAAKKVMVVLNDQTNATRKSRKIAISKRIMGLTMNLKMTAGLVLVHRKI